MANRPYDVDAAGKPTNRRLVDAGGPDFFPTPEWATQALLAYERFEGEVWECACGDGAIARVLAEHGCSVRATDLHDRGFGQGGTDFLAATDRTGNVVTNPPFNLAEDFIRVALQLADRKVALLLRLAFLEGAGRYRSLFSDRPPARVLVFTERITFYPSGVQQGGSGTTAYAWFVWDKDAPPGTVLKWLEPGLKALFS